MAAGLMSSIKHITTISMVRLRIGCSGTNKVLLSLYLGVPQDAAAGGNHLNAVNISHVY